MNITIEDMEIADEWDYQKAALLLRWAGISSEGMNGVEWKELKAVEEKVTRWMWDKVREQFPKVTEFLTDHAGGFNRPSISNYNTPIISIHGNFYMQLIVANNNREGWCWEEVELEPYRFIFNEEGYFISQCVDAANRLIAEGWPKSRFRKLIAAFNATKPSQDVIGITNSGDVVMHRQTITYK